MRAQSHAGKSHCKSAAAGAVVPKLAHPRSVVGTRGAVAAQRVPAAVAQRTVRVPVVDQWYLGELGYRAALGRWWLLVVAQRRKAGVLQNKTKQNTHRF